MYKEPTTTPHPLRRPLTLSEVKSAARLAMSEGRLGYQMGELNCAYTGVTGAPCAVGAAMTDAERRLLKAEGANGSTIQQLGSFFEIAEEELEPIAAVQQAHDDIINERCGVGADYEGGTALDRLRHEADRAREAYLVAILADLIAE